MVLPSEFEERIKAQFGEESEAFFHALREKPPVSIRLNPAKPTSRYDALEKVAWCERGRYLEERPSFVQDPLIFAGAYYVQEASSMFLHTILQQHADLRQALNVLDLCAAPGGKSTLISALLTENSLLVSNELVSKRVPALFENLVRWGNGHHLISQNKAGDFSHVKEFFDVVVVDAPCSGEGMFRKEKNALLQWSPQLVSGCAFTQKEILGEIIPSLKPEGLLIYSTCTYAPQEDEEILSWLVDTGNFEPVSVQLPEKSGIMKVFVSRENTLYEAYRFMPHRVKGEGFFIACLRKKASVYSRSGLKRGKKEMKLEILPKKYLNLLKDWLKNPASLEILQHGETLYAIPENKTKDILLLNSHLRLHLVGIELGVLKNNKFVPSHHLAMSHLLPENFPTFELSYEQAIAYLQKKDFALSTNGYQGWALVSYECLPLGFVRILPQRFNNHYPS
ncbi:MAG: RsmB/NOP family class I SAM-dependent RNA methyltransferase, partial [Flammeovirgaceae bacterium]|nr:RsmB/NOP family class I SAM-dependent RNA methyltransferase [Flammeovirgaceae bacterium]MDW8286946.1 RsmB/NOP family class I SAM-dependent RNA methyltransferase [Flammeovirgaceae bacterium]